MATKRKIKTAADTSEELRQEFLQAMNNPKEIFGFAHYGDRWPRLNKMSGGLQPLNWSVIAARPKVGKSMLVTGWIPDIAEQALGEGKVVRIITLEMTRKSYQRRMAAIMAQISDPMNIRRGLLSTEEQKRYLNALKYLEALPIEYLSNERDLTDEESMIVGNSPVTFRDIDRFVRANDDTFWWVLDHVGLVANQDNAGDVTRSIYTLANELAGLAHTVASGLTVTHLTRASVGGMPTLESIAGSDQIGRNFDQLFLLSRPFRDAKDLTEEQIEMLKKGEPAFLQYMSRDEGSGLDVLWWDNDLASFREYPEMEEGVELPLPASMKK